MVLEGMCKDPSLDGRYIFRVGFEGYRRHPCHPMNHLPDSIRDKIETHLEMVLRVEPGASDRINTCGMYSPEINTQENFAGLVGTAFGGR